MWSGPSTDRPRKQISLVSTFSLLTDVFALCDAPIEIGRLPLHGNREVVYLYGEWTHIYVHGCHFEVFGGEDFIFALIFGPSFPSQQLRHLVFLEFL